MGTSVNTYYDDLDLKYPELAIAMDIIDITNPGKIRFSIPVLTPNMNRDIPQDDVEHQTNSDIINADRSSISIQNITMSNYMKIEVPAEVCGKLGGSYWISESDADVKGKLSALVPKYIPSTALKVPGLDKYKVKPSSVNVDWKSDKVHYSANGLVSDPGGVIDVVGTVEEGHHFEMSGEDAVLTLDTTTEKNEIVKISHIPLKIMPTPDRRYIKKKSKWIVLFIGGDVSKPKIIAPYEPPEFLTVEEVLKEKLSVF